MEAFFSTSEQHQQLHLHSPPHRHHQRHYYRHQTSIHDYRSGILTYLEHQVTNKLKA
jgi:hypothetical protein